MSVFSGGKINKLVDPSTVSKNPKGKAKNTASTSQKTEYNKRRGNRETK